MLINAFYCLNTSCIDNMHNIMKTVVNAIYTTGLHITGDILSDNLTI